MDQATLTAGLAANRLGWLEYHPRTGSTNDEASRLVQAGCPDLSLVVAGEQTSGRGRLNRRWFTPPGAALAFSLVLVPDNAWLALDAREVGTVLPRVTALGALAVCQALETRYSLAAQIKWPNDVLVNQRKLAGVLVETTWEGELLKAVILGIGLNIASHSVPPAAELLFPATSLEDCLMAKMDDAERLALLKDILERIREWRVKVSGVEFIQAWQTKLAYLDEWVWIVPAQAQAGDSQSAVKVRILGLEADGSLRVEDQNGTVRRYTSAEVHLRPHSTDF